MTHRGFLDVNPLAAIVWLLKIQLCLTFPGERCLMRSSVGKMTSASSEHVRNQIVFVSREGVSYHRIMARLTFSEGGNTQGSLKDFKV